MRSQNGVEVQIRLQCGPSSQPAEIKQQGMHSMARHKATRWQGPCPGRISSLPPAATALALPPSRQSARARRRTFDRRLSSMLHVRSRVFLHRISAKAGDLKVAVRESRYTNTPSHSCTLAPSVICATSIVYSQRLGSIRSVRCPSM